MAKLNINRKMSIQELQDSMLEAQRDYRWYMKFYHMLFNKYGSKNKQVNKGFSHANHAEKRYTVAEALLSNR